MSLAPNSREQLHSEIEQARNLHAILQKEQSALIASDLIALEAAVIEKNIALEALKALSLSRLNLLDENGFTCNIDGMNNYLDALAKNDPHESRILRQTWNEYLSLTHHTKELNRVNGVLIAQQMVRVETGLKALRRSPHDGHGVYGSDGQASKPPVGRGLAVG